jgi:peptide/nickel transport system ATP-binding protein
VAVMRAGQFVETGPVEQILRRPAHAHTRELLAAVPEVPAG